MSTTETKVRHSALPWRFDGSVTIDAQGKAVLSVPASANLRAANREFMLRAVNSHADMLEALEAMTGAIRTAHNVYQSAAAKWLMDTASFRQCEAAIARAKGGAA